MSEVIAVLTITMLAVISPGADFAMVTRNSMVLSRRTGVFTAIGIALGVLVHVAYSVLGLGLLISQSIVLFNVIKWVGAAYLIYLGITLLRAKSGDVETDATAGIKCISDKAALRLGFFTNALNPKTTLFVVALFTQVIRPETPMSVQLFYGVLMSVAHLVWFVFVAYAFSSNTAQALVDSCRHIVERTIGGVLVLLGLGLAASSLKRA